MQSCCSRCCLGLWCSSMFKYCKLSANSYDSKLDWLIGIVISISLQWQATCHFSRHYKDCMSDIFMEYIHACLRDFDNWMDGFVHDSSHNEKNVRRCEEFDNFTENQLIRFKQQVIQQIVLTLLHTCNLKIKIWSDPNLLFWERKKIWFKNWVKAIEPAVLQS